mmetsp:Transcript_9850/g.14518  ORF Transcript_9850/g.14518 Transcript_9850/m.14518 type:complete len:392 (+) Transcript_9850:1009-2184(+)
MGNKESTNISLELITELSNDELCVVFEYLQIDTILNLSVVSKEFNNIINSMEILWERLCRRDFFLGKKEEIAKMSSHWKIEYICYYFRRFSFTERNRYVELKSYDTIAYGKHREVAFANVRPKVNLMNAYDAILHSSPKNWVNDQSKPPIVELEYEYDIDESYFGHVRGYAAVGFATEHLMRNSFKTLKFRVGGPSFEEHINIFNQTAETLRNCRLDVGNLKGLFKDRYLGAYACMANMDNIINESLKANTYLVSDERHMKYLNFGLFDNGLASIFGSEIAPSYDLLSKSRVKIRYETKTYYPKNFKILTSTEKIIHPKGTGMIQIHVKPRSDLEFDHIITFYNVFHKSQKEMCLVCSIGNFTSWSCVRTHVSYPGAPEQELNPMAFMEDW